MTARFPNPGRKQRVSSQNIRYPFEIIIEILSWLPVESLVRFKCLCSQWFLLIDRDSNFIEKHMVRGSSSLLPYYQNSPQLDYTQAISDETFQYRSCYRGLCLESKVDSRSIARIRNPATRRVLYLPDAHKDAYKLCMDFDPSAGEYKVLCIYFIKEDNNGGEEENEYLDNGIGLEILTVGKDEQWRPLKHPIQNLLDEATTRSFFGVISSTDNVHVSEIIRNEVEDYIAIYHLDMASESFTTSTFTRRVFSGLSYISDVQYFLWDDRLAVGEITGHTLRAVVSEDCKQQSKWSENKIIPLRFLDDDPLLMDTIRFYGCYSNELLFVKDSGEHLCYDMKTEETRVVEFADGFDEDFKSSLVNIKGMKPE